MGTYLVILDTQTGHSHTCRAGRSSGPLAQVQAEYCAAQLFPARKRGTYRALISFGTRLAVVPVK